MRQEIEIEFKMLLTKDEYDRLLQHLPFPNKSDRQTNYYFETNSFSLKHNNAALRIREKNNSFTLTLKQPHEDGILETHQTLTEQEANRWIEQKPILKNDIIRYLELLNIPINDLQYYGCLTTERRQFEQDNIIYVLDKSFYNEKIDYELEIEARSKQEGEQTFQHLLDKFNIENKQTVTKIERFFQTLKE